MMFTKYLSYLNKSKLKKFLVTASLVLSTSVSATIVVFDTSQGQIKVNLFDQTTPETVENFLTYVNNGDYTNTVIHRGVPSFVLQGGGYTFEGDFPLTPITTNAAVINEPVWSNQRGTIAMAKQAEKPNSATSQWFFNAVNNTNLDATNGGFTVFGQVIEEGMAVVDNILQLSRCSSIPMIDYDCQTGDTPGSENFVILYNITIIDTTLDTASTLNPIANTADNNDDEPSSSGGSSNYFYLLLLSLVFKLRTKQC